MNKTLLKANEQKNRSTVRIANSDQQPIKVIELFAGVGGFRLGLEEANKGLKQEKFKVVWSNQWEPSTRTQHASDIYVKHFGSDGHANADISKMDIKDIPDHDMLVGGFPCQDYSVARTLSQANGLAGKKGVLWWEIHRIIKEKGNKAPAFLMLENVDRLLKSPAKHRGRDFAIMLASLADLGYVVEWRVINAADYGMPQRRRRVFIVGYKKGSSIYKDIKNTANKLDWVIKEGIMAKAFPVQSIRSELFGNTFPLKGDLAQITEVFEKQKVTISLFENSGIIVDRNVHTLTTKPNYEGKRIVLNDIIVADETKIPKEYFIEKKDLERWQYLKGPKKEPRKTSKGHVYIYSEGGMKFPEPLDQPSRTIITSEGGSNPSRFKHVIRTTSGRYRRLLPVELEQLNQFPSHHTEGIPDGKRAFLMGNALVVGIVERLGVSLSKAFTAQVNE